jgi:hypothetical protein
VWQLHISDLMKFQGVFADTNSPRELCLGGVDVSAKMFERLVGDVLASGPSRSSLDTGPPLAASSARLRM